MRNYYGSLSQEPTELELKNRALAREAAAEGFVLLKNDGGALPLRNKKIALYGMGARKTVKGGLGSGSVEERYSVNIEDGLKNAGYEITSQAWLDDYDKEYTEQYQTWHDMVEEQVKDLKSMPEIIVKAHSYVFRYPSGRLVTQADVDASDTDTALYVVMRQAGECNDRKLEKGDYYLTDIERENLSFLAKAYAHTILIINVGGLIDLGFLDVIEGIDAVVQFVQGGEEGGSALADVLSGKGNFSGKLTDTIPMKYEDIPFGNKFSYLGGDPDNSYYSEGIYVGYRYFDSFGVPVRYPFGYGLSYTTFSIKAGEIISGDYSTVTSSGAGAVPDGKAADCCAEETGEFCVDRPAVTIAVERQFTLPVRVTNTGSVAGKEVVQLYVSAPAGSQEKEYQRLVAFTKTKELKPGETQELTLTFALSDLASYDEANAQEVLDGGDYIFRLGNSSRDTKPAAIIRLDGRAVTRQLKNCMVPTDELPVFRPQAQAGTLSAFQKQTDVSSAVQEQADAKASVGTVEGKAFLAGSADSPQTQNGSAEGTMAAGTIAWQAPGDVPVVEINAASIGTVVIDYTEPEWIGTEAETRILDSLTVEEQAQLLRGGDLQRAPKESFQINGAGGKTSTALLGKGISNVIFSDGPAGVNIVPQVFAMPDGTEIAAQVPERYSWGTLVAGMKAYFARIEAPKVYRYATAWPVSMLRAQTWNTDLLEKIGDAVGSEMETFGITIWLAPGMNIHKNPLCGRNFEYYSEDPVLSGKMASALTKGVQSHPGCGVSIKHFCCNNIEDNRFGVSANVSERALREIYLKGFEIAVKEAQPMTVMSSYNLVNHVYNANSHELLTDILRCEWGFKGLVMTDWGSCDPGRGDAGKCTAAGNDLIMPGIQADYDAIIAGLGNGSITPEQVRRSAGRVLRMMLQANTSVLSEP